MTAHWDDPEEESHERSVNGVWRPTVIKDDRPQGARPDGFNIVDTASIYAPLPPVAWLCQSLYMAPGAPSLFVGYGYSGKSVALQSFALSVATGKPVWGHFAPRRGRVLHLDYEQGGRLTRERYQRLSIHMQLHPDDIDGRLELGVLPSVSLTTDALKRLGENRDFVVIDSWRASHPAVDENSSEVRRTLDAMAYASEATGATFAGLHHTRKPQKDGAGGAKMAIRGSSGFYDGCQTVYIFDGEEAGKPVVTLEKERISGQKMTFSLVIQDEMHGHGLSVTYAGNPEDKVKEGYAQIRGKILAFIGKHPGVPGIDSLSLQMSMSAHTIRAHVKSFEAEGEIVLLEIPGRGKAVRIYLKKDVPLDPFAASST